MLLSLKAWERVADQSLVGRDFVRRDLLLGTLERGPIESIEEDEGGVDLIITTARAAKKLPDGSWVEIKPITCLVQKRLNLVDCNDGGFVFEIDIDGIGIICPPKTNLDFGRVRCPAA